MEHQGCHSICGCSGLGSVIGLEHICPVVGRVAEICGEGKAIVLITITSFALGRTFPELHHLGHGCGYTTSDKPRRFCIIFGNSYNFTIIRFFLTPFHLDQRVYLRTIGCSLRPACICLPSLLCPGNLLGILSEPPLEVFGSLVVVKGAVVAIAENLTGGFVATCDDETLVVADIEYIEAGLCFTFRGVGQGEILCHQLPLGTPGACGLAGKEFEGVALGFIDTHFLCHCCIARQ